MASVGALKQFLEQFDDDTEVQVVAHDPDDCQAYEIDLGLDQSSEEWNYMDFSEVLNPSHSMYERRILVFGRIG